MGRTSVCAIAIAAALGFATPANAMDPCDAGRSGVRTRSHPQLLRRKRTNGHPADCDADAEAGASHSGHI